MWLSKGAVLVAANTANMSYNANNGMAYDVFLEIIVTILGRRKNVSLLHILLNMNYL